MEPRRDPLTLDSFPGRLPRWRERTRSALIAQLVELIRLEVTAHPDDAYSRSDLLVMAAERADDLDVQTLAEPLFTLACLLETDNVFSARAHMLRWQLGQDWWDAMELSESWRRDQSCSVLDHEQLALIWMDEGEYRRAWGWIERGLMLAEELDLSVTTMRRLQHVRYDVLECLGIEPLEQLDPGCTCLTCSEDWPKVA